MRTCKRMMFLSALCAMVLVQTAPMVSVQAEETGRIEVEYSRISMGGGYSAVGQFVIDDAITQGTAATSQSSFRFEVVSVKSESEDLTPVIHWEEYSQ